jgi:hypothetical protein
MPITQERQLSGSRAAIIVAALLLGWGVVWSVAYFLLPNAHGHLAYGLSPALSSTYWLVCFGVVLALFWPNIRRFAPAGHSITTYGVIIAFVSALYFLYASILPALGPRVSSGISGVIAFGDAGFAYMLPKAVEIVFQQAFILALVSVFAGYRNDIRFVACAYAIVFGTAHLLLLFALSVQAALLVSLFAAASALLFPYLMLRVTNGFVYAYMSHWLFYVVLVLLQFA